MHRQSTDSQDSSAKMSQSHARAPNSLSTLPLINNMSKLRDRLSFKHTRAALAEKEVLKRENRATRPLTQRNIDTFLIEQDLNDARFSQSIQSIGMSRATKVAIIGAGPSGLVTAKTLLHHYPKGRFEPVIFDSKPTVGGLWAVTRPDASNSITNDGTDPSSTDFIDCFMRTNLSRFTVSFSDHSWETENHRARDSDQDLFPQAWEVGDYLTSYAARFLPEKQGILRLSCRVVRTRRNPDSTAAKRWTVEWVEEGSTTNIAQSKDADGLLSESFDYLVVASGYFSRPYIPDIAGLHEFPPERVMHSSSLKSPSCSQFIRSSNDGKILVVGGSMSGAEAAASLALDLSTARQTTTTTTTKKKSSVHHISTRPFWAVPTYLPANDQPGSFLPLDIVMYDLARRPPGDIQYSLGPLTSERANMVHSYFKSLIGSDQSDVAEALAITAEADTNSAPWVAVTDHYAEFARAGDITPTLGRVSGINWNSNVHAAEANGVVEVEDREGGSITTIDNVVAIVFATGFTPFGSLSFLPEDVLSVLEFSKSDTVFPIVLDEKGTWNPDIADLGFVGFYRGPYWGVMEMQARALAHRWDRADIDTGSTADTSKLRSLRTSPSPPQLRAQFPMGDYVGLIETYARELDIPRLSLHTGDDDSERSGPAIPARYFVPLHNSGPGLISVDTKTNHATTITSLQTLLLQPSSRDRQRARCKAVLRALHGKWQYERMSSKTASQSGHASINLRKVHDPSTGFRTEYVYEGSGGTIVTIFDISKDGYLHITGQDGIQGELEFVSVEKKENQSCYRHVAREREAENNGLVLREFVFDMRGVVMTSWEEKVEDRRERTVTVTRYTR
ncbi:hypothetical protein UA08_04601 [Talaromyces atroroseus]|uniref:FAD/NAD(P)-binding domain-containing protein n=1 Tax=Talaromyces atroroseus TaxID=1441469 RepID=A0A225AFT4_TALAT|nr:hypothetical protein UA08_04601 [Talaromyces atroroseus]OKL60201.1 hypothetical protein UA08_04601 [Talaromyces atroroseus]